MRLAPASGLARCTGAPVACFRGARRPMVEMAVRQQNGRQLCAVLFQLGQVGLGVCGRVYGNGRARAVQHKGRCWCKGAQGP